MWSAKSLRQHKVAKGDVAYTDHGSAQEHCSICEHYVGANTCNTVSGRVVPGGWCKLFNPKGT